MSITNIDLADLGAGESGRVVRVSGGWGVQRRLQALGIRPGAAVTKVKKEYAK